MQKSNPCVQVYEPQAWLCAHSTGCWSSSLCITEICLTSSDRRAIDLEKHKLPHVEYIVDISFDRDP